MLLAVLCLFFISLGTTFASNVSDNTNINFKNENYTNTVDEGISENVDGVSAWSGDKDEISDSDNDAANNTFKNVNSNTISSDTTNNSNNDESSTNTSKSVDTSIDTSTTVDSNIESSNCVDTDSDSSNSLDTSINNSNSSNTSSNISNNVNTEKGNSSNSNINNNATNANVPNSTTTNASNTTVPNNTTSNTVNSKTTSSNKNLAAAGDVIPTKLTQSQILAASNTVYKYVLKNKKLPNSITIAGYKYSMPEFMYLLSKTIVYKYKKITSSVTVKYNVKNPTKPFGTTIKAKMSSKYYYKYANNIANYIAKYNRAPNYVLTSWGKMQYQTAIYGFSSLLRWSYTHKSKLPSSLTVKVSKSHKMNKNIPKYTRTVASSSSSSTTDSSKAKIPSSVLNNKYNGESLSKYLTDSKNCQVSSSTIKSLASSITKNCKTELEKATAIFNWVRDKVSYSFYYNTKKGAVKTLSAKSGNCVDQTHLLIALMRSSGIAAKYVHGKATFSSGSRYGHVWAQVLIGDNWVVADTTSSRNSLGVVNNWNVKTVTINGKYSSLSF